MKYTLTIFSLIILFFSCSKALKNTEDYFPDLTMTAEIQQDGSVLVTGTIIKNGAGPLSDIGFSFSENEDWYITENQILLGPNDKFSFIYEQGFDPAKTYYFRAFAVNNYGYKLSKVVSLSAIKAVPVVAPCVLNPNIIKLNSSNYAITNFVAANHGFDYVSYQCSANSYTFTIEFDKPPLTGIYTTRPAITQGEKNVVVTMFNGFESQHLSYDKVVYVNRIDANNFMVEICDATWTVGSFIYNFKCNFTRPY